MDKHIVAKVERYAGRYIITVPDGVAARLGLRADDRVRLDKLTGAPALTDELRAVAEASWAEAAPAYRALAELPDPEPVLPPAGRAPAAPPGESAIDTPASYQPSVGDALALHAFVMERLGRPPAALRDEAALRRLNATPMLLRIGADLAWAVVPLLTEPLIVGIWAAGNGPTALALGDTFLRLHGEAITGGYDRLGAYLAAVAAADEASREARIEALVAWLQPQVPSYPPDDDMETTPPVGR